MIRLLTAVFLLALICGGALAAPFSVSYVGTMQNSTTAGAFFSNIVNGEIYKVTLVMDNGGNSSQSQTWVASDLVIVKWEFNESRNVVFEQNIDPSYTDNYSIIGTATTDANSALTGFFTDISNGGAVFQAVGLPDLVSPAAWFLNGTNDVFYGDADVTNGSYRPWVADAAGGAQMNIASWSSPVAVASAPATPSAPGATSGNAQASVTWTKPDDGGSTITGYTVTSSPDGQTCSTNDADTLSCVVTGLTNGTAYTFTVTATNDVGTSTSSSASNSVTPATTPSAPSAPVATSGNAQAAVTWSKSADGGSTITSYTVTSSPGGETCSTNDADTLTCDVTGLTNGTAYTFTVTATNGVGTSASSSASNSVTPAEPAQAAPSVPVPTLPSFLLVVLGGLLALCGFVGARASK